MENEQKILLPNGYLSWSAMSCWLSNKTRFRREYFEKSDKLDTKYLRFGKGFAKLMEDIHANPQVLEDPVWVKNNLDLDIKSDEYNSFKRDLVWYSHPEFKVFCEVNGVQCLSYLDTYNMNDTEKGPANIFRDDKTGKNPWTQAKVQKHDQLLFYATVLKWSTGKMPDHCYLDWIETYENDGEIEDFWRSNEKKIRVTGRIVTFKREFDEREIERMENLIVKVANEISEAYRKFIEEI